MQFILLLIMYFYTPRNNLKKETNGILIKSFYGDKSDTGLISLGELLIKIKDSEDIREAMKEFV